MSPATLAKRHTDLHAQGKLTAKERLQVLFDDGLYKRLDGRGNALAGTQSADAGLAAGRGTVNGRAVVAFSQDMGDDAPALTPDQAAKICALIDDAVVNGEPVVGLLDCPGLPIGDGAAANVAHANLLKSFALAGAVVPRLVALMGPSVGSSALIAGAADVLLMTRRTAELYVTGSDVVGRVTHRQVSASALGGSEAHLAASGLCSYAGPDEIATIVQLRRLLGFLNVAPRETHDPADRTVPVLDRLVPSDQAQPYDIKDVLLRVVDEAAFFELQPEHAPNIVAGLARLSGVSVGLLANQPLHLAGCLDIAAMTKAARFVDLCGRLGMPVVTLADVPGFLPGLDQEHGGIARAGAALVNAYAAAPVPRLALITRRAYGGGYELMASKALHPDGVLAWRNAEIAIMAPSRAAEVLFREEAADLVRIKRRIEDYRREVASCDNALRRGWVDAVIHPRDTRATLCRWIGTVACRRFDEHRSDA